MPFSRSGYTKKRRNKSKSKTSGDVSNKKSKTNLVSERSWNEASGESSKENEASAENGSFLVSERIKNGASGESLKENEASAENGSFNNEDELISKLYKEVIDDIMKLKSRKFIVNDLNIEMLRLIRKAESKSKVKENQKMDLSKASNLCVYLSVHGTCHTGLVKNAIRAYLQFTKVSLPTNRLKVVSLGGGPGYDLVGFCSAFYETYTLMNKIKCKIVDTKDWQPVFKSILRITKEYDYGNLSELHKKVTISGSFIDADLKADDIFKNESFSSAIKEADFILMVKLESFLTNYGDKNFIKKVFDAMKDGSKFIFMYKKKSDLLGGISNAFKIYKKYHEYEISFNPAEYNKFSTSSDGAHICVFQKIEFCDD